EVGASSPATRLSSVLLPQPDAPIRQANSPGATSRDSRSRASSAEPPRPKTLETSPIRIPADEAGRGRAGAPGSSSGGAAPLRWATLMNSPVVVQPLSAAC